MFDFLSLAKKFKRTFFANKTDISFKESLCNWCFLLGIIMTNWLINWRSCKLNSNSYNYSIIICCRVSVKVFYCFGGISFSWPLCLLLWGRQWKEEKAIVIEVMRSANCTILLAHDDQIWEKDAKRENFNIIYSAFFATLLIRQCSTETIHIVKVILNSQTRVPLTGFWY